MVAWLVGWLVGWLHGCLVAWLPGCMVAWLLFFYSVGPLSRLLVFISNVFFQLSLGVAYKTSLFGLKFCLSVAYFMTV